MATVSELYYDIGQRIGDPGNAQVKSWQLLKWINKAIRDTERVTKHLKANITLSGQYQITVKDYSSLATDVITLQTSNDSAASTYTGGSEWTPATSNAQTASSIATALNAHADVYAYAGFDNDNTTYAYVYVLAGRGYIVDTLTCDADTDYLDIDDAGYEIIELSNIVSTFRQVRNIYDTANERFYVSYTRQQYDRTLCDSGFTGYGYYVDPLYKLYIKKGGGNLDSSDTFKMDYMYWSTALTTASQSPAGILQFYDELIVQRVLYYYI